jgi:membrane protease YdiL (CAAX protease family)
MKQSTIQPTKLVDATQTFLVGVALLALSAIGGFLIIRGFEYLQTVMGSENFALTFLIGGGLATLWLGVFGVVYLRFRPVTLHYGLRWPTLRDTGWIIGGLIAVVLVSVIVEVVFIPFSDGSATTISAAAAVENPLMIYTIFLIGNLVLIAPIEEFLYRGVIQGRLREAFGPIAAISITAIGFALGHLLSYWYGGSDLVSVSVFAELFGIAAVGLVLGIIYERTESLLLVSIIHGLANSIGIAIALVAIL